MRIGIAGVGRIGAFHARTLRRLDGVDELLVTDADRGRAAGVAREIGAACCDDPNDLLAAGIDGLVVAAATPAHPELILAGVEAGIPVFCEKPVAADLDGARAVLDTVAGADIPVQIGFQRRFDAGYAAARDAVAAGRLGWLHTVRAITSDVRPPPVEFIATSGGLFRDCSVHDFDAIRWVSGQEIVEVYATGAHQGDSFVAGGGDVASAGAMLTLTSGTCAQVSASRYNAAGYDVRLELLGSADSVAVGQDRRTPLVSLEPGVPNPDTASYADFMDRFKDAYIAELRAFVDLIAGAATSPCTVADAVESFLVAEACELSLRQRRPVRIEEVR